MPNATMTAQERLIDSVESMPNLIKVIMGGKVDKVFRVEPLLARVLNLDRAPDAEEWAKIQRLIYLRAPLEQRGLEPVEVGTRKEWTLMPEQVPVVKLTGEVPSELRPEFKAPDAPKGPGRPKKEVN